MVVDEFFPRKGIIPRFDPRVSTRIIEDREDFRIQWGPITGLRNRGIQLRAQITAAPPVEPQSQIHKISPIEVLPQHFEVTGVHHTGE